MPPPVVGMGGPRDVAFILGDNWRRGLRRLSPQSLTKAAVLLARSGNVPQNSSCDATVWPESRRQRLEGVLRQLSDSGNQGIPDLATSDWASVLWSAAKCKAALPDDVAQAGSAAIAAGCAAGAPGTLAPSDSARLIWSAATLRWKDQAFLKGATDSAREAFEDCSPQDLSNMIWGAATLRTESLFGFAFDVASVFARRYSVPLSLSGEAASSPPPAQAVGNVLWGLATIGARSDETGRNQAAELMTSIGPAAVATLPTSTPQGVAYMLWAHARVQAREEVFVDAACRHMSQLLAEAETQHLANAAWAVAKLTANGFSSASSSMPSHRCWSKTPNILPSAETLLVNIGSYLHARPGKAGARRWSMCSYKNASMLCWSYAKAMPKHKTTRQVLRDAVEQAEELSDQGGLRAQEHANILWAWAESIDGWRPSERPLKLLKRALGMFCNPTLQLADDGPLCWVMTANALAKLRPLVSPESQADIARWLERISRQSASKGALSKLSPAEVVVLLRAMTSAKALHAVLYHAILRELRENDGFSRLRPHEFSPLLEAGAYLRPEKMPTALADLLGDAVSRLQEFGTKDIAAFLWALERLSRSTPSSRLNLEAVSASCSQALGARGLHFCALRGSDNEESAALDVSSSSLTVREWVWVMNHFGAEPSTAPNWAVDQLIQPWSMWLEKLARELELAAENTVARRARVPGPVASAAQFRYNAVLRRENVDGLGSRWTPLFLRHLGIAYVSQDQSPEPALEALQAEQLLRHDGGRFGRFAWLQVLCQNPGQPDTENISFVRHCWGGVAASSTQDGETIVSNDDVTNLSDRDDVDETEKQTNLKIAVNADLRLLAELTSTLGNREGVAWAGNVFLYLNRVPSLACMGALSQMRQRWPEICFTVAFQHGPPHGLVPNPSVSSVADPIANAVSVHDQLETAIRRAIPVNPDTGEQMGRIAVLAMDPRVKELWPKVCATSSKLFEKKREWHDKLKYFISHRRGAFAIEEKQPAAIVRVLSHSCPNESEIIEKRVRKQEELVSAIETAIAGLLRKGRTSCLAGEGYVPMEDVGCHEGMHAAWRDFRHDSKDRLAFFARHSNRFDTWSSAQDGPSRDDVHSLELSPDPAPRFQRTVGKGKSSWVRIRP